MFPSVNIYYHCYENSGLICGGGTNKIYYGNTVIMSFNFNINQRELGIN